MGRRRRSLNPAPAIATNGEAVKGMESTTARAAASKFASPNRFACLEDLEEDHEDSPYPTGAAMAFYSCEDYATHFPELPLCNNEHIETSRKPTQSCAPLLLDGQTPALDKLEDDDHNTKKKSKNRKKESEASESEKKTARAHPLTSFYLFPKLPAELRIKIWKFSYSEYGSIYKLDFAGHITNHDTVTFEMPNVALVTKESWEVASKRYLDLEYKPVVYVNVTDSTIVFTPTLPDFIYPECLQVYIRKEKDFQRQQIGELPADYGHKIGRLLAKAERPQMDSLPMWYKTQERRFRHLSPHSSALLAAAKHWASNFVLAPYNFDKEELMKHATTPHSSNDFNDRVSFWAEPAVNEFMGFIVQQFDLLSEPQTETLELIISKPWRTSEWDAEYQYGRFNGGWSPANAMTEYIKWQEKEAEYHKPKDAYKSTVAYHTTTILDSVANEEWVVRKISWRQCWEWIHSPAILRIIEEELRRWTNDYRQKCIDRRVPAPKWLSNVSIVMEPYYQRN